MHSIASNVSLVDTSFHMRDSRKHKPTKNEYIHSSVNFKYHWPRGTVKIQVHTGKVTFFHSRFHNYIGWQCPAILEPHRYWYVIMPWCSCSRNGLEIKWGSEMWQQIISSETERITFHTYGKYRSKFQESNVKYK